MFCCCNADPEPGIAAVQVMAPQSIWQQKEDEQKLPVVEPQEAEGKAGANGEAVEEKLTAAELQGAEDNAQQLLDEQTKEVVELPQIFEVSIPKTGALGLKLDVRNSYGHVMEIVHGCVQGYNSGVAKPQQVLEDDLLIAINGVKLKHNGLLDVDKLDGEVTLKLLRPVQRAVKIHKGGKSWGLRLAFFHDTQIAEILTVLPDGAIAEYNLTAPPGMQLKERDLIKSINGVSGSKEGMLKAVQEAAELDMTVLKTTS